MIDLIQMGSKIAGLRLGKRLSQDQLAERLLVSRQAVSAWELGKSAPSIDNVIELAKTFDVSFEDILCLHDETHFSSQDYFEGHDRAFVIRSVIEGKFSVPIPEILYQCTGSERLTILKAIKEKRLACNVSLIESKLSDDEKEFLKKGGN